MKLNKNKKIWMRRVEYYKSSDKADDKQILFFNEAEVTAKAEIEEPTMEKITCERKKKICIVEHVRKVYACRTCQESGKNTPIITAKMPEPVISGSFASPSLIAYLMYQKYSKALPLDRQERIFTDFCIDISKQNMSNWIIKASEL